MHTRHARTRSIVMNIRLSRVRKINIQERTPPKLDCKQIEMDRSTIYIYIALTGALLIYYILTCLLGGALNIIVVYIYKGLKFTACIWRQAQQVAIVDSSSAVPQAPIYSQLHPLHIIKAFKDICSVLGQNTWARTYYIIYNGIVIASQWCIARILSNIVTMDADHLIAFDYLTPVRASSRSPPHLKWANSHSCKGWYGTE